MFKELREYIKKAIASNDKETIFLWMCFSEMLDNNDPEVKSALSRRVSYLLTGEDCKEVAKIIRKEVATRGGSDEQEAALSTKGKANIIQFPNRA